MSLKILRTVDAMKMYRSSLGSKSIGFVPTMGALHRGHLTLAKESLEDNDITIFSIFVNPTQFNNPDDLRNYPRNLEKDFALLEQAGCDAVFVPEVDAIYPDSYRFQVNENENSLPLCGRSRPGHFSGVLTVVLKLLNLVQPTRAYFGEKDYQQYLLIKEMASAFFLPVDVIGCRTVREADGLALSSRNQRLTSEQRKLAPELYRALKSAPSIDEAKVILERQGLKVDYLDELWGRRFGAVYLGDVRLIDNVQI